MTKNVEYKESFSIVRVPAPLANVSSAISTMDEMEKEMIADIAAEIGAEISDLYESANNEESDYRDMREFTAMSRISELSDMAGSIANDSRIRNASLIAEYKNSPAHSLAVSIIDAFGGNKNVVTVINSHSMVELHSAKSDLGRGIDTLTFIGKAEFFEGAFRFYPVNKDGELRHAIAFESFSEFFAAINTDKMFPVRVNRVSKKSEFRNGPKGAKGTAIADKTGITASGNADKEIALTSNAAILEEAAKFGYFPLPNFQGERKVTEEDKKARASIKKRNQRAKAKAVEAMDEKKIAIMEMIDAITKKNAAAKSSKGISTAAIVPAKASNGSAFDIAEYFAEYETEREAIAIANDKARTEWAAEFAKRMDAYAKR